jgi:maltose alpha-D-glucosyltransferase/alpha-amylase
MSWSATTRRPAPLVCARRARPEVPCETSYVWSETNQKYQDARIIFKDSEVSNWTWDHLAGAYYWHRFFSHQPDLNYDNPRVKEAMFKTCDFWLDMGLDGMRLDATPYLFEREGTNSENLPETHGFLKELRAHIDANYRNRMLLSEANQWPEDAVAYFGQGDECNMNFHFPLMPRLFMSIRMEDRFPLIDSLAQTPPIPDSSQWALFLRNHDELTLEMVTDEERDYMYRAYTQDRAARINLGIRRRLARCSATSAAIELMNGLLLVARDARHLLRRRDRDGRQHLSRRPQWRAHAHAVERRPQRRLLRVEPAAAVIAGDHRPGVSLRDGQRRDAAPEPALAAVLMKRVIALRKRHRAFGRGTLELLRPENRKILAFVRRYESSRSWSSPTCRDSLQTVELDLSPWKGMVPWSCSAPPTSRSSARRHTS